MCWRQNKGGHRSKRSEVSLDHVLQNIHKRLNLLYSGSITRTRYIEWLREGYLFCRVKTRIDGFCVTYTRYGMFPINLHMNRNHCCREGIVLKNLNAFFRIWRSTQTMCRVNRRHARPAYNGGANILEARHYILQYTKVSDPNSSHARRKLHPQTPPVTPDHQTIIITSPRDIMVTAISLPFTTHPLSIGRSRSIISIYVPKRIVSLFLLLLLLLFRNCMAFI